MRRALRKAHCTGFVEAARRRRRRRGCCEQTGIEAASLPAQPLSRQTGTEIVMPQMGESIFEGTITKWLKKAGDAV